MNGEGTENRRANLGQVHKVYDVLSKGLLSVACEFFHGACILNTSGLYGVLHCANNHVNPDLSTEKTRGGRDVCADGLSILPTDRRLVD